MTPEELDRLRSEETKGHNAEKAYEQFIGPFVIEKRLVLFEAFKEISVENEKALMECKRQLLAIESLNDDITTIIDTGKMARKSIAEEESKE